MFKTCKQDAFINGVTLLKDLQYEVLKLKTGYQVRNHYNHITTISKKKFQELFE